MFPPSNGRPHYGFTLLPFCLLLFLALPLPLLLPRLLPFLLPLLLPRLPKPTKAGFEPLNLHDPCTHTRSAHNPRAELNYLLPKIHNTSLVSAGNLQSLFYGMTLQSFLLLLSFSISRCGLACGHLYRRLF